MFELGITDLLASPNLRVFDWRPVFPAGPGPIWYQPGLVPYAWRAQRPDITGGHIERLRRTWLRRAAHQRGVLPSQLVVDMNTATLFGGNS